MRGMWGDGDVGLGSHLKLGMWGWGCGAVVAASNVGWGAGGMEMMGMRG